MDIAGTVRAASGDQSASASRMLQDVLASFSERLNELFGDQISGLSDLNRQTAQSVRDVIQTLNGLVANIETANAKSGDVMAARMAEAVERLERRQEGMNSQTAAFVEQLRQLATTSQDETHKKMQSALTALSQQVEQMVASLRMASEKSLEENRAREETIVSRTASTVASMTGSVDVAVKEMVAAAAGMQQAVVKLSTMTEAALDKMSYGADRLSSASETFANAGERVSATLVNAATVTGQLTTLAGALTSSSSALQHTVADYAAQRDAVTRLVAELRSVVESSRKEASLTSDVLQRIQSATDKLVEAQRQADRYLESIGDVLGKAHHDFAESTVKTLDRVNSEFHSKLSSAVNLISSSILELEATLGGAANVRKSA
jgi:ABC-type transporter Mla subunit MlaD